MQKYLIGGVVLVVLVLVIMLNLKEGKIHSLERELAEAKVDTITIAAPPDTVTVTHDSTITVYVDSVTGNMKLTDKLSTLFFEIETEVNTVPLRFQYKWWPKPLEISIHINKSVFCTLSPNYPATVLVQRGPLPLVRLSYLLLWGLDMFRKNRLHLRVSNLVVRLACMQLLRPSQ